VGSTAGTAQEGVGRIGSIAPNQTGQTHPYIHEPLQALYGVFQQAGTGPSVNQVSQGTAEPSSVLVGTTFGGKNKKCVQ
jgi:hypothetical protein